MAIDGIIYSGKEVQVGFSDETTFGTAVVDAGAFNVIPDFGSISIDYGIFQDTSARNRGKRIAYDADIYTSQTGGIRVITMNDIVIHHGTLSRLLYGVFQNVTEGAETPFEKTFSIADTQPDFSSNEGYFFTLGIKNPIAAYDEKFTSCIVQSLSLHADLIGGDGRLRANATIISGFANDLAATFSGTWSVEAASTYIDCNLFDTKTYNTSDMVLYSFNIDINNAAKRIGNTIAGNCEGYTIAVPEATITGSIKAKYDTTIQAANGDYIAGTERVIEWGLANGTATGDIMFDMNEAQLTNVSHDDGNDTGIARDLEFKAVAIAAANPEIRFADGIDRSW